MKNEEPTPIVDAFLEEWLANRRPRGLTVEGLSRREYSPMRLAELDEAVKLARADGQPRRVLRSAEEYRRGRSSSWVWPTTLAALAASVALAFGLRHFWLPSTPVSIRRISQGSGPADRGRGRPTATPEAPATRKSPCPILRTDRRGGSYGSSERRSKGTFPEGGAIS